MTDEHLSMAKPTRDRPRRILALSGGGVRGIVEVAFLEAVEASYKRRFAPNIRLCDIFDLVGGSSTGALIATAISLGHPMERIKDFYLNRAADFFSDRRWWRFGRAPVFDCERLEREFRHDVGDLTLGDPALQTYLAIITKRLDTGSPWIVNNIPGAPFFDDPPDGSFRGNRHFQLARLLRATTAAPLFFSQKAIRLHTDGAEGVFVDGGLSPYNDPSLALLQLARMKAFGLNWDLGVENMFVLSIGTGRRRVRIAADVAARKGPLRLLAASLRGVLSDYEVHTLTMMEWMGRSAAPSVINSEIGALGHETLFDEPLFDFLRLDLPLDPDGPLGLTASQSRRLSRIDTPGSIAELYELTRGYVSKTWDLDAVLA